MEKGGVEGREADWDTWEIRRGTVDCLTLTYTLNSCEARTSVALSALAGKDQTGTPWTDIGGHIPSYNTSPVIESKLKPVLK